MWKRAHMPYLRFLLFGLWLTLTHVFVRVCSKRYITGHLLCNLAIIPNPKNEKKKQNRIFVLVPFQRYWHDSIPYRRLHLLHNGNYILYIYKICFCTHISHSLAYLYVLMCTRHFIAYVRRTYQRKERFYIFCCLKPAFSVNLLINGRTYKV